MAASVVIRWVVTLAGYQGGTYGLPMQREGGLQELHREVCGVVTPLGSPKLFVSRTPLFIPYSTNFLKPPCMAALEASRGRRKRRVGPG